MELLPLRSALRAACWVGLGALLLASLGLLQGHVRFPWQPLAWAGLAAAALLAHHVALLPPSSEERLGAALCSLALCGGVAALGPPPLGPGSLALAAAWGSGVLVWHQLATLHLELEASAPGLSPLQEELLARVGMARLRALARALPGVVGLSLLPLAFAALPLVPRAGPGPLLLLFALLLGIAAGTQLLLRWRLHRSGPSGASG